MRNFWESGVRCDFKVSNRFHWIQGHEKPRKQKKNHYFSSFLVNFRGGGFLGIGQKMRKILVFIPRKKLGKLDLDDFSEVFS